MTPDQGSAGLRVPRWLLFGAMAILLLVIAIVWQAQDRVQEARRVELVFEQPTEVGAGKLMDCLDDLRVNGLGLGERRKPTWAPVKGLSDTMRAHNEARPIYVDVVERRSHRIVRFFTRKGRPLRSSERAVLKHCLAP